MEKSIYELLNKVETDFSKYEITDLSPEEKENFKTKILMEVKDMKAEEKKKNRKSWKKAAGVAAAIAVAVGTAGIAANPVLAKQIVSNVFGMLINHSNDTFIGEKELYTKVGENAKPVAEEVDKYNETGEFVTSVEKNGVTLSVSEVYCDGSVLYYSMMVKTDNEDLKKGDHLLTYLQDGDWPSPVLEREDGSNIPISGGTFGGLEKVEEGVYVGMESVQLFGDSGSRDEKLQLGKDKNFIVNYTMNGVTGIILEEMDEQGHHKETGRVEEKWKLRFPVTVEDSENETIEVNKGENGIIVKDIIRTKTLLIVKINYSGYATKPPYNYEGVPCVSVRDSEGQLIGLGGGSGGSEPFTIQDEFLYDGQKDLVIEVSDYDRETQSNTHIADIPVTLP